MLLVIGYGNELPSRLIRADCVADPLEKVVSQNIGLRGTARFARYDEQGLGEIEIGFERLDLRRDSRIKNAQARPAAAVTESRRQHFGAETGAAHAEKDCVLESFMLDLIRG